ncbi:hypothetical protein HYH02_006743 [Chlamydomonas schloesseri]|uniref:Uncharacterized protein n=1 Tax=Chlamydomonas schloesseri TaxID=2026947 RepID=A0A835WIZ2_9CHLO|nr:hypothetical protein HYH02_006743 [Chlamydomonas schloesseri]|eukprot:KAG2448158.1 hypothetical protein HYH02_006743 [Chlamydomonas schloesseri]
MHDDTGPSPLRASRAGASFLLSAASTSGTAQAHGGCDHLAGALAPQQRSALVALACPDLPPSALSGRLHLQAQQRARSALGRHERACASGYRPHLRAAATARAVLAAGAGLAPADEAAAAREHQAVQHHRRENALWQNLLDAATVCAHYTYEYRKAHVPSVELADNVVQALGRVGQATRALCARAVATMVACLPVAADAEQQQRQRQHTTAFGCVVSDVSECVEAPSWLLAREAARMLPARAALLLHCHDVLARPVEPYDVLLGEEVAEAAADAAATGADHDFAFGGLTVGQHMAAATVLADALQRHWDPGSRSHQWPLLCTDLTVLASVVSAAQALVLQQSTSIAQAGGPGVLAALTRPAVLLRAARVVSSELLFQVPPCDALPLVRSMLRHYFCSCLQDAFASALRLRGCMAAAATAAADVAKGVNGAAAAHGLGGAGGESDAQQQRQRLVAEMQQLRRLFEEAQEGCGKLLRQDYTRLLEAEEEVAAVAPRQEATAAQAGGGGGGSKPKGKVGAPGPPPKHSERHAAPAAEGVVSEQRRRLAHDRRTHLRLGLGLQVSRFRLAPAMFDTPLPPAGSAAAATTTATAAAAVAMPFTHAIQPPPPSPPLPQRELPLPLPRTQQQQHHHQQQHGQHQGKQPQPSPQPPQVVLMLPAAARHHAELDAIGSGEDRWVESEERAAFGWAAAESANRAAVARAMVGVLTPCWEAPLATLQRLRMSASGGPSVAAPAVTTAERPAAAEQPPPPLPPIPGPSPSSLVLQGAPAICYSLARTAAVNYVLDRVARGLAAAVTASEAVPDAALPPLQARLAAELAAVAAAAAGERHDPDRLPGSIRALAYTSEGASRVFAAVNKATSTLDECHQICGWPLVMTLESGSQELWERQQAGGVPQEQLMLLQDLRGGVDTEALLQREARLVATWAAQPGLAQAQDSPPGAQQGEEDTKGALAAAVRARISHELPVCDDAGVGTTGAALGSLLESALQRHPLRAAWLQPAHDQQTLAVALALAEPAHGGRARTAAADPSGEALVAVPLLDESVLKAEAGEPVRRHLQAVAQLVLRDVTQPTTTLGDGSAELHGQQHDEAAARNQRGGGSSSSTDSSSSTTRRMPPLVGACRKLRDDWPLRLPLALNRAVCRVANLGYHTVGWALSSLSPLQLEPAGGRASSMAFRTASSLLVDAALRRVEQGPPPAPPPEASPSDPTSLDVGEQMAQECEILKQGLASAQDVMQLCCALADLEAAGQEAAERDGDGPERELSRAQDLHLLAPDVLDDLLAAPPVPDWGREEVVAEEGVADEGVAEEGGAEEGKEEKGMGTGEEGAGRAGAGGRRGGSSVAGPGVRLRRQALQLLGRDANSATNMRHALMEMLLGNERPAALRPGGGGRGPGPGGGGPGPSGQGPGPGGGSPGPGGGARGPSGSSPGPGGGGGPGPGGECVHVRSGGGGQGHMEEESAEPPKKRRWHAG